MNSGNSVPNMALPEAAVNVGVWLHCVQLTHCSVDLAAAYKAISGQYAAMSLVDFAACTGTCKVWCSFLRVHCPATPLWPPWSDFA